MSALDDPFRAERARLRVAFPPQHSTPYPRITLADGAEWACNAEGFGLFSRRTDGSWQQHLGTSQTPVFSSAAALSRYVHRLGRERGETLPRMISSFGWGR